jgi:hypothetical protein
MKKYIIIIVAIVGIIACGKDKITDSLAPVITIILPASGFMYSSGDSIPIYVTVTDEDMHEVTFKVANAADTSIVYFVDGEHTHDLNVDYSNKFLAPAVGSHTNVIFTVHAEDHNGHESDKSVTFSIMP